MSSTNRGAQRAELDTYPTPDWLTQAILQVLGKRLPSGSVDVFEPACGSKQAIVQAVKSEWPKAQVTCSDIIEPWSADFLTLSPEPRFDLIITNPPFSLAMEFIERAFQWRRSDDSIVAMLLRLNFLGSKRRAPWLRAHMPSVYVTPKRPSFSVNKKGKLGTDSVEYAWFVWDGRLPEVGVLETDLL